MKIRQLLTLVFIVIVGILPAYSQNNTGGLLERRRDKKSLLAGITSTNTNTKVRSAINLWANYADSKKAVLDVMQKDKDPEVRRRIAQVLARKHKAPQAISILRTSLRKANITTQRGASAFLMTAISLHSATGEQVGIKNGLQILSAPTTWFQDVQGEPYPYARKDAARFLAASYLARVNDPGSKKDLGEALRIYATHIVRKLKGASGQERKFWEMRLPAVLNIAIRSGNPDVALEFAGKVELFKNKYEREQLERVLKKAKAIK